MPHVDRRTFLKGSLAAAGATFIIGVSGREVLGANEVIRVGVAGIRGRGGGHIGEFLRIPEVRIAYLIDIDKQTFGSRRGTIEKKLLDEARREYLAKLPEADRKARQEADQAHKKHAGLIKKLGKRKPEELTDEQKQELAAARAAESEYAAQSKALAAQLRKGIEAQVPICVQDVRKALDDKDLAAISIATPNHWHALMTIWACQAGKDVYVEKPCSHNIFEGRKAVEAARKYKRIVQHGTQSRSDGKWARLAAIARSGKLGKVLVSHGIASKPRGGIGHKKPGTPPAHIDFNLWLGPAQRVPYHANLVHYNWHWFWDFGCGEIGNQGVHQMDLARWMIPDATWPTTVVSMGGRFVWGDQGETPNTQLTVFEFGDSLLVFENCNLTDGKTRRVDNDVYFEAGRVVGGSRFYPKDSDKAASLPKVDFKLGPGRGPFGNFIECVKSRKAEDLNADILEGHYSSGLCHLGNTSYRLGKDLPFAQTGIFPDRSFAAGRWEDLKKLLSQRRKVNLGQTPCRVGRRLKFDGKNEKFVDCPEADKLLTRDYRPPFVVPEEV